jgi:uncharacterized protein (AIM24 family)
MGSQPSFQVIGDDMQAVEIDLAPGQAVIAEAGTLILLEEGITFQALMADGTEPAGQGLLGSLKGAVKRVGSQAGLFLTHFTNLTQNSRKAVFGAGNPGKLVPIELPSWGGQILCAASSFVCAEMGTKVDAVLVKQPSVGLFGGSGFILQKLSGDGRVFLHATGSLLRRELKGESLRIEPGALVAFSPDLDYSIERAGDLKTMLFGGDGLFLVTLRGHGSVLINSLPWRRVVHQIVEQVPRQ